jgi:hypothetical protein
MPLLDATLKIADGAGGTYTYPNAKFDKRELGSKVSLNNDGRIEKGNFTVGLRSAGLMGASSPLGLPGGSFADPFQPRAAVELGGEIVFEGRVSKADVASDPADAQGTREWTVTIQGSAFSDVLDALSATDVFADEILSATGFYRELNTHWTDDDDNKQGPEILRWYDLTRLWRIAVEAVGPFVFRKTIDLFPLEVKYENGDGNNDTYYRAQHPLICSLQAASFDDEGRALIDHTLPNWTCQDLYEFLRRVTGYRLRADYDPFPSEVVRLMEIEGEHSPPASELPVLEDYKKKERYDLSTHRPENPDFALRLEGQTLDDSEAPPDVAIYAAFHPQITTDGEADNENVQELDMRAPSYEAQEKLEFSDGDFSERYTAGEPHIDTEHVFWTAITEVEGAKDNPTKLRARDASGKPNVYNEIWLNEHYWRHALTVAPLHKVTGRFDVSDLSRLRVGEIDSGFRLEGKDWLVRSIARNEDVGTAQIVGVRPTAEYSPGRLAGSVLGAPVRVLLLGNFEDSDGDGELEYYLSASWDQPTGGIGPVDYQWEIYDEDGSLTAEGATSNTRSAWTEVTPERFDSAEYSRVRARYTLAPEWISDWSESYGYGIDNGYML